MFRFLLMLVGLLWLPAGTAAQDAAGSADHPALTRYPGSVIRWHDVQNFAPYKIATGPVTGYRQIDGWTEVEGRLTRIYYELIGERSHSEVYHNYKSALLAEDFTILSDGLDDGARRNNNIGGRKWLGIVFGENSLPSSAGIELLNGSATAGGSAYVAGRKDRAAGAIYVAVTVTQQRADRVLAMVDVLEVAAVETGLVTADADAMGEDIDEYGKVALYGLYFDHDKASLKAESAPALEQIAKLLQARPSLNVYVVGHTDMRGGLDYNRNLSLARAEAVKSALVQDHGIAPSRLTPMGVGPLSPVFSNRQDAGRAKNRRVELVERD
ncbi:MAG: OmpA family protein [Sphingomonadales bacterium]